MLLVHEFAHHVLYDMTFAYDLTLTYDPTHDSDLGTYLVKAAVGSAILNGYFL